MIVEFFDRQDGKNPLNGTSISDETHLLNIILWGNFCRPRIEAVSADTRRFRSFANHDRTNQFDRVGDVNRFTGHTFDASAVRSSVINVS
jgi:hypothetical protein